MKVYSSLTVIEVSGKSREDLEDLPRCEISSHWNDNDLIVLQVCNQTVTLKAKEVVLAVENATNTK